MGSEQARGKAAVRRAALVAAITALAVSGWCRPVQLLHGLRSQRLAPGAEQLEAFVSAVRVRTPPYARVVFFVPENFAEEGYFGYRAGYLLPRRWAYLGVPVPAMGAPRFLRKGDYAAFWKLSAPPDAPKVWEGEGGTLVQTRR